MENPRNQSPVNTEGSLVSTYGDSVLFTDSENNFFYQLSKEPKKQFVVAQLASLILSVAIPYMREVDGKLEFFSPDVKKHPEFKKTSGSFSIVDKTLLTILFGDSDHYEQHNHYGSVFYDFDFASVQNGFGIKETLEDFIKKFPSKIPELVEKTKKFQKELEGQKGLEFIKAVVKKADYTHKKPEEIQKVLLNRCSVSIDLLIK